MLFLLFQRRETYRDRICSMPLMLFFPLLSSLSPNSFQGSFRSNSLRLVHGRRLQRLVNDEISLLIGESSLFNAGVGLREMKD